MLRHILASLACLLTVAVADDPPVQLLSTTPLAPTSTLEVRFNADMVAADQIGKPVEPPPLVLTPTVAGTFQWVSTRSGMFKPSEPYPLGTTVQITLRDDLKTLKGTELPADWKAVVSAPLFALQAWNPTEYSTKENASALPCFALLFNADMSAETAAASMWFVRDGSTDKVPANVEVPGGKRRSLSYFSNWLIGGGRSTLTWAERFRGEEGPAGERDNQLFVSPAKPLTPGENWRFIVDAGLPAKDGDLRLLAKTELIVGTVKPFEVAEVEASNVLNQGRHLRVTFNKTLAEDVKPETVARWISVKPEPPNFKPEITGSQVELAGDFELGKKYRVAIEPGLAAREPFVLAQGVIREVTFEPVPPRLYFEAFQTHQQSAQTRQFHLLAVNVPRIRVSAKLFTGNSVPVGLRGYEDGYFREKDADGNETDGYTKVNVDKLPGRVVWQKDIGGTDTIDEETEIALDWNEILGPNRTGVVMLTAEQAPEKGKREKRPGAQAVVQLTDLGAVWKRSPTEIFAHVFSMENGTAVAGAKLRLLDEKDKPLGEAIADKNGLARFAAPKIRPAWLEIRTATDIHAVAFTNGSYGIDLARVDVQYDEEEEASSSNAIKAFLFTERGVYKPGELVHLKGIVRDWSTGRSRIVPGAKARLVCEDAREREFFTKEITISATGSFAEDINLPKGTLGTFTAQVKFGKAGDDESAAAIHEFEVQEYKPNAFEIAIAPPPTEPGPAKLALPITAKYYMGKALSKAQLTWSIDAHDEDFEPEGFDDFDFGHAISDSRLNRDLDELSHFSAQGKETLDPHGNCMINSMIPLNTKAPQPRSVRVLCEVTDVDQQTVSESKRYTQQSSDFYLGVRRFRSLVHEGETLPIEIVAIRTDGTPTPEPVSAKLQLTRIDWQNNRVETAGEATEYKNEPKFELVMSRDIKTSAVTKEGRKWIGAALAEPLVAAKPGQYLLQLSTQDTAGRKVLTTTMFQVYGEGESAWSYRNPYQVELVPDKDDYLVGDSAKILVKTPISGDALITIEREKVLRSFIVHLEGNAPAITVPLEAGDAPNVFVSVMLLRGAKDSPRQFKAPEYRIGYCELAVARPESKLAVYVKPDKKAYQPADEVTTDVEVLDYAGHPVAGAEVTLYAVDEGVLSLTGYTTPDPLAFFNEKRALTVSTALTLPALLDEDPEKRDFGNKGYLIGGGGDDNDGMRKNFLACAYWAASLVTDAQGKLSARFTAPDSLTRYRVIAVVQTKQDQFGGGESSFEVNKPVMLEPSLPRFANVGDKLALRAVLHNTTALDGDVVVVLTLDPTAKGGETTRIVALPAHGSLALDFPVEFIETGKATWKWVASFSAKDGTRFRDAVQSELNVGFPAPLLREVRTYRVESAEANALAKVDPRILEGTGVVRVSIANSRAVDLQESIRQLLHYPYGCVEQTTSSTLPWLTLRDFRGMLPALNKSDEEIAGAINRGMDRLWSMQTDSGGLSYWPGGGSPMLWGSAYGSLALTLAKKQGIQIADEDYDRLLKWMSEQLRGTAEIKKHWELGERCLVLYALAVAGRAEPAYYEILFKRREELASDDRAILALAIAESKGSAAMIDELLKPVTTEFDDDYFYIPARSTAMQLLAWSKSRPKSPRIEELATELFSERREGHWMTTQGNAWAMIAMSNYLKQYESGNKSVVGRLQWGKSEDEFSLGSKAESTTRELKLSADVAHVPLRIEKARPGIVFSEVTVEAHPQLAAQPAQDRGYALTRRYSKVEDDGSLSDANNLRVGDRVLITLNLEVRKRAAYLAIEDPLPANFEALNPTFKSQATRAGEQLGTNWMSDYHEFREDRALFFADRIGQGRYTLRYLARVTAAGTATAPSAKVEEMYHPERSGLTESIQVASLPLQ
jgi:uncharacterized protein YfaS (alpha-2-macroglobulin family)